MKNKLCLSCIRMSYDIKILEPFHRMKFLTAQIYVILQQLFALKLWTNRYVFLTFLPIAFNADFKVIYMAKCNNFCR